MVLLHRPFGSFFCEFNNKQTLITIFYVSVLFFSMAKEHKVAKDGLELVLRQTDSPQPRLVTCKSHGLYIRINSHAIYVQPRYSKPCLPIICIKSSERFFVPFHPLDAKEPPLNFLGSIVGDDGDIWPMPNFLKSIVDDDGDIGLVFGNDHSDGKIVFYPACFNVDSGLLVKSRWQASAF